MFPLKLLFVKQHPIKEWYDIKVYLNMHDVCKFIRKLYEYLIVLAKSINRLNKGQPHFLGFIILFQNTFYKKRSPGLVIIQL